MNFAYSVMSFLNCVKYPPSLLFLLMTLGGSFMALAAFDHGLGRVGNPLRTFGRVPLFFYLLQWPVAHGLALIVAAIQGYPIGWMFQLPPFQSPAGYGDSLLTVYLFWAITLALLYFPCRWYSGLATKLRRWPEQRNFWFAACNSGHRLIRLTCWIATADRPSQRGQGGTSEGPSA